jgi:hypothetical protein
MTWNAFILFLLGALLEIVWLWDDAHGQTGALIQVRFLPFVLRPAQWIQAGLMVAAGLLFGVFSLFRIAKLQASMDNPVIGLIFVALGLFILGAGVVANGLLPRINEQSILITQLLVILSGILNGVLSNLWGVFFMLIIPAVLVLYLVWNRRPLSSLMKSLIYLWYLASLLILTFQNGNVELFTASRLTLGDAYFLGITFIFILLHGLFSIRFFLIVSSLILPRNHKLTAGMMSRLFADDQVPVLRFFLFALGLFGAILLNAWLDLLPRAVILNLAVIACVQFFFKPRLY